MSDKLNNGELKNVVGGAKEIDFTCWRCGGKDYTIISADPAGNTKVKCNCCGTESTIKCLR